MRDRSARHLTHGKSRSATFRPALTATAQAGGRAATAILIRMVDIKPIQRKVRGAAIGRMETGTVEQPAGLHYPDTAAPCLRVPW